MKGRDAMHCGRPCKIAGTVVLTAAVVVGGLLTLRSTTADAREPLGRNWPADQRISMDDIDHVPFNTLLNRYVDKDGYVDYRAWHASADDRATLRGYLDSLSRASTTAKASGRAQLAFWINAYNALTLEGILAEYPTDSIRNHTSKLGGYNVWKDLPLLVGGREHSLDAIEHQILRKMREPRIHFAIVCASVGCPRLRNEAYTAAKVDEQLADNARDFFSRSTNLRVDARANTLHASAILDWFGEDFGGSQRERWASLSKYLPKSAQQVVASGRLTVKYLDYDWGLNDQARKPRTASRS